MDLGKNTWDWFHGDVGSVEGVWNAHKDKMINYFHLANSWGKVNKQMTHYKLGYHLGCQIPLRMEFTRHVKSMVGNSSNN